MSAERRRNGAERTVFAVSAAILLAVVALLVVDLVGSDDPAAPVATASDPRRVEDAFVVPVEVGNEGDAAAFDVEVRATLTLDGVTEEEGAVVVPFLPGHATEEVVFRFTTDPADGELEVEVTSFAVP